MRRPGEATIQVEGVIETYWKVAILGATFNTTEVPVSGSLGTTYRVDLWNPMGVPIGTGSELTDERVAVQGIIVQGDNASATGAYPVVCPEVANGILSPGVCIDQRNRNFSWASGSYTTGPAVARMKLAFYTPDGWQGYLAEFEVPITLVSGNRP